MTTPPNDIKPCETCQQAERVPGERFCKNCKKAVLMKIRNAAWQQDKVRTVYRDGADMVGRRAIAPQQAAHLEDQEDDQ